MSERPREPSRHQRAADAADKNWGSSRRPNDASLAAEKAERDRHRAERARARAEATPVKIVDIDLPFGAVFAVVVHVFFAQAIIAVVVGGVVLVALLFFGVI